MAQLKITKKVNGEKCARSDKSSETEESLRAAEEKPSTRPRHSPVAVAVGVGVAEPRAWEVAERVRVARAEGMGLGRGGAKGGVVEGV